jgi:hypothetical protein
VDVTGWSIKVWFCLGVAIVAASIADPMVEAASNAGWFGSGPFTDHSSLDIVPALLVGCFFLALQLVSRVRRLLSDPAARPPSLLRASTEAVGNRVAGFLPATFGLQMVVLFAMETAEQFVVWGHGLGGTIWLGGPVLVTLAAHAAVCVAVAFAVAHCVRLLSATTLRVICAIRALAVSEHDSASIALRRIGGPTFERTVPVLCRIGERAPPLLQRA